LGKLDIKPQNIVKLALDTDKSLLLEYDADELLSVEEYPLIGIPTHFLFNLIILNKFRNRNFKMFMISY
jgi:hypothetical protein